MQYTEIINCEITEEFGSSFVYRYYLIEGTKRLSLGNTSMDLVCYGVKVLKEERINDTLNYVEENSVEDISPNMDKVMGLINFLGNKNVSPVHLLDVISEIVDEWNGDFDLAVRDAVGYY